MTGALQATMAKLLAKHQSYRQAHCPQQKNKLKRIENHKLTGISVPIIEYNRIHIKNDPRRRQRKRNMKVFVIIV